MESDNINSSSVANSVLKKLSAEFITKFCMFVDHQNVTNTFEHPLYFALLLHILPAVCLSFFVSFLLSVVLVYGK